MLCACGCGEGFEPERANQIYKDASHRQRDKNRRWPVTRRKAFQVTLRDGHRERQKAQSAGVTPLLGTEMAETKEQRRNRARKQASSELLSPFQVARFLGMSVWTLILWRKKGFGPPFLRITRSIIRYPKPGFDAWLASLPKNWWRGSRKCG
jgi:hypothetical protein